MVWEISFPTSCPSRPKGRVEPNDCRAHPGQSLQPFSYVLLPGLGVVSICFNTLLFYLLHFICYFKSLLVNRFLLESLSSIQLVQMQPISIICCLVSLSALMLSACSCCKIKVSLLRGRKQFAEGRGSFCSCPDRKRRILPESQEGRNLTRNSLLTQKKAGRRWGCRVCWITPLQQVVASQPQRGVSTVSRADRMQRGPATCVCSISYSTEQLMSKHRMSGLLQTCNSHPRHRCSLASPDMLRKNFSHFSFHVIDVLKTLLHEERFQKG